LESQHSLHRLGKGWGKPSGSAEPIQQLPIRLRLAEALVRDNVRRHIECSLDGDLQRVLDDLADNTRVPSIGIRQADPQRRRAA